MTSLEKLIARQAALRNESVGACSDETYYVSFASGGSQYLVPIENVREVAPMAAIKPYPAPEPGHVGVVNLRGSVVPILSLHGSSPGPDARILILSFSAGECFGILGSRPRKIQLPEEERSRIVNLDGVPIRVLSSEDFKSLKERAHEKV